MTVRNVSISASFFSASGASSMKDMATCTILVVACLSWPCFFESNKICSFNSPQSPESFDIVIMATSSLDVEARSDAWFQSRSAKTVAGVLGISHLSCVLLERREFFECCLNVLFRKLLRLGYLLVNIFSIVFFGLEKLSIRHDVDRLALMLLGDRASCRMMI